MRGEHGFTLVELMVVLLLIGLMTGAVMLTMADPRGRMHDEADRFAGRVRSARDSAILSGHSVALWVSRTGYGFQRREQGQWARFDENALADRNWATGVSAGLGEAGRARILFDTVGRADQPLDFLLQRDGRTIRVRMDLDGKVTTIG